jgi:hypothetical protein
MAALVEPVAARRPIRIAAFEPAEGPPGRMAVAFESADGRRVRMAAVFERAEMPKE